ncbi:unnamed protein product, partial [marine sediment metagenome]
IPKEYQSKDISDYIKDHKLTKTIKLLKNLI